VHACLCRRSELSFAASAAATPLLRLLDGESAHRLAVWAAANGLVPRERRPDPPSLQVGHRRRARIVLGAVRMPPIAHALTHTIARRACAARR
jgi:hypothetical protein